MKKHLMVMLLAAAAQNINAQLVVDEDGKVGIGTESPQALLQIDKSTATDLGNVRGIKVYSRNSFGKNIGIESRAVSSSSFTCAVLGGVDSTFSAPAAGVMGYATWGTSAAIYGSAYSSTPSFSYSGLYAGYFNGNMRVTGSTYSNAYLTSSGSIYSYMTPLANAFPSTDNENNERVSDKLSQLQAVQFLRDEAGKKPSDYSQTSEARGEAKLSPIQYGLDPKQLKEVYPELVYEDENGNVSINYVEMVPLLVQSINELSQELAELKGTSSKKAKKKAEATTIDEATFEVDIVRMDQNKPNPFSESTVITLNIPKNTQKANIFIYDMSGKQVKAIPVSERGETNITVFASDLTAGMYIYTLVVDGKVAVTRKMIVSEV
mgnify:CR=1 FL=1